MTRTVTASELAHDGLDVVAVGIEEKSCVVAAGLRRAVLLAHSRCAVVCVTGFDSGAVEGIDFVARTGDERDVDRPARLGVRTDDEIGVLAAVLALQSGGMSRVARTVR
jgi:hypothetical protein